MKSLAELALVVLPLGVAIMEILAGGNTAPVSLHPDPGMERPADSDSGATALPLAEGSRAKTRRSIPPRTSGALDGHADPGKPA